MAAPLTKSSRSEVNKRCRNSKNYPEEEDRNMIHYLAERAKQTNSPLSMALLWQDFKEWSGSARTISGLRGRFRRHISGNIHRMTNYDTESRVRMLFATRTRVDEQFLEELRQFATVQVDPNGAIFEYNDANTGLNLMAFNRKAVSNGENERKRTRPEEDLDYDSEVEEVTYDGLEQREKVRKFNVHHPKMEHYYGADDDFPPIEEEQDFTEYKPNFHLPPVRGSLQNQRLANSSSPRNSDHFGTNFAHSPENLGLTTSEGDSGASGADSGAQRKAEKSEMCEFMSVMKDFVSTQTQWVKMQMDGQKGPSTSSTPCSSSTPSSSTFPSTSSMNTSKKGFLFLLRSLVLGMDRPEMEPIRRRISREIQKIGDGDEKIAVETINNLLEGVMNGI